MTGLVLICKPDGTQELVERELPDIEPTPEPENPQVVTYDELAAAFTEGVNESL